MNINLSYDKEFDTLWEELKKKYPQKLFDLDGVGKQLDMAKFSKNYFSQKGITTADISVDANSNVSDTSVVSYDSELMKPFERLNSYYMLWKYAKKYYGKDFANKVIEMQLTGDFYINDFHHFFLKPYSYLKETNLIIKYNNKIEMISMNDLFNRFKNEVECLPDREQIDLTNKSIFILDKNSKFVKLNCILRHKNTQGLLKLETKSGEITIVTKDHPVILKDGSEKFAQDLSLEDELMTDNSIKDIELGSEDNIDFGYFLGMFVGDGYLELTDKDGYIKEKRYNNMFGNIKPENIIRGNIVMCQNNISESKIYKVMNKLYPNKVNIRNEENRKAYISDLDLCKYLCQTGIGSKNRKLPNDILKYSKETLKSVLSGIIDSEGNVNCKNGIITVRVTSFQLAQQVADILRILNCGNFRISLVNSYSQRKNSYKSNYDLYRISIRLKDKSLCKYSEKVSLNQNIIFKDMNIDGRFETNKLNKITDYLPKEEYVYDVTTETGHFYSEGLIQHNCFNYSTYDILTYGLPYIDRIKCVQPKYLLTFKQQLEQFTVFASNNQSGASGEADLLVIMSYYVNNCLKTKSDCHFKFDTEEDVWTYVKEILTSYIYTINQPFRSNQSPFTNVSLYDTYFLEEMCKDIYFPDGTHPDVKIIQKLQEIFVDIMNEELSRTPITFPVVTACYSRDDNNNIQDEAFNDFIAEANSKWGFINIYSGDSSTLSSCCRLRSNKENEYFNSFGAGSSKIGSLGVVTLNVARIGKLAKGNEEKMFKKLEELTEIACKINNIKRNILKERIENGNLPLYTLGYMDINKQYSTTGVNGINECLSFMGKDVLTKEGQDMIMNIIETINNVNDKMSKRYKVPTNCEQTPSESSAVKLADKDKLLKIQNEFDLYSNQFIPLTTNADMLDRIKLQGMFDAEFTGGAICHINVENKITNVEDMKLLIKNTIKRGVVYFAINYNLQRCANGHMTVGKKDTCSICGEPITDNYLRVVGFLTNTKNWNKTRREVDYPNRQFYKGINE